MSGEVKAQFANDVRRERKRVLYEGTDTIYEGMALCYNYDTTTNVTGWSRSSAAEGTTTSEGYQNEGKYLRVEKPATANHPFFAGVVAPGSWVGKTGTGSLWIEVYVPNGAIVPVYTDKNVAAKDIVNLENSAYTLINDGQCPVGHFVETIDRSSTAGLALAQIVLPKIVPTVVTAAIGPSPAIWGNVDLDELRNNFSAGILYENDFTGNDNLVTAESTVITQTTTGTVKLLAAEGGALIVDSAGNTTADDGAEVQFTQCRFLPAAGRNIYFEARVKMNDATDQYFIGLAETDTSLMASGVIDDVSDKCGFFHHAASTDNKISSIVSNDAADDATADVAANVDNTYTTLGFILKGVTSVEFYVNGALVETGTTAASLPNEEMCLSMVSKIEGTGADAEMTVDWVRIAQVGART